MNHRFACIDFRDLTIGLCGHCSLRILAALIAATFKKISYLIYQLGHLSRSLDGPKVNLVSFLEYSYIVTSLVMRLGFL